MKSSARTAIGILAVPLALTAALAWYGSLETGRSSDPGSVLVVPNSTILALGAIILLAYLSALFLSVAWRMLRVRGKGSRWVVDASLAGLAVAGFPGSALVTTLYEHTFGWIFLVFVLAAPWFAAMFLARQQELSAWRPLLLFGAVLANVALFAVGLSYSVNHAREEASLRLPTGRHLRVLFFLPERNVLTEDLGESPFLYRGKILGTSDCEYTNALVVRPAGMPYPAKSASEPRFMHGVLLAGPAARFVAHAFPWPLHGRPEVGCATNLAYDLEGQESWSYHDLRELSPFIFIGTDDRLDRKDASALLQAYGTGGQGHYIVDPSTETLAKDLSHPNPEVRELIAQMLGRARLREHFLDAEEKELVQRSLRRLLREDSDPRVREAARAALALAPSNTSRGGPNQRAGVS